MAVRAETQIDLARVDDGSPGTPGANGATFTPSVDSAGNISWTNDGGLPNPQTQNIMGPSSQYFWYESSGADAGAHITEVPQDEWTDVSDPNYHSGGNLLARSSGIAVRDGMMDMATFGADGISLLSADSQNNYVRTFSASVSTHSDTTSQQVSYALSYATSDISVPKQSTKSHTESFTVSEINDVATDEYFNIKWSVRWTHDGMYGSFVSLSRFKKGTAKTDSSIPTYDPYDISCSIVVSYDGTDEITVALNVTNSDTGVSSPPYVISAQLNSIGYYTDVTGKPSIVVYGDCNLSDGNSGSTVMQGDCYIATSADLDSAISALGWTDDVTPAITHAWAPTIYLNGALDTQFNVVGFPHDGLIQFESSDTNVFTVSKHPTDWNRAILLSKGAGTATLKGYFYVGDVEISNTWTVVAS